MAEEEVRPRLGHVKHSGGATTPIMFTPSDNDAAVFVAVHLDGRPVRMIPGDVLEVDVIGPGQTVTIEQVAPESDPAP